MKVVLNRCYGGFGLSKKARKMLGIEWIWEIDRTDPKLIEVVESLGKEANGNYASLEVVEIPAKATDWEIEECNGAECLLYVLNGKICRS